MGVPFSSVSSAADRLSLASKRCVYDPRSSSNFVMRFTCTGKMLAYYLCSPHWPSIRGTIIQLCRKEPALWQVKRGTIIQLCRKEPVIEKITHHHPSSSSFEYLETGLAFKIFWVASGRIDVLSVQGIEFGRASGLSGHGLVMA